jgi:hypothetical protein
MAGAEEGLRLIAEDYSFKQMDNTTISGSKNGRNQSFST